GLSIFVLVSSIPFGITGIVVASGLSMLVGTVVNTIYSGKLIGYSFISQIKDISPILLIGGILCYFVNFGIQLLDFDILKSDIIHIGVYFILFFGLYYFILKLLNFSALQDIRNLFLTYSNKN